MFKSLRWNILGIPQHICIKNRRESYNGNKTNSRRKIIFSGLEFHGKHSTEGKKPKWDRRNPDFACPILRNTDR
jgi:hypothetical protein